MAATLAVTRSLVIRASQEQVWETLIDPESIAAWLTDFHFEAFEPGAKFTNGEGDEAEPGEIVAIDPPRCFSFRWTAEQKREGMTMVTINLEPVHAGTRVTVVESGFEQLEDDVLKSSFERNSKGWGIALEGLAELVEKAESDAGDGLDGR
jgi:uncharacterized protein YndB with AHSA1/START domain